jgi:hypothetical protein
MRNNICSVLNFFPFVETLLLHGDKYGSGSSVTTPESWLVANKKETSADGGEEEGDSDGDGAQEEAGQED